LRTSFGFEQERHFSNAIDPVDVDKTPVADKNISVREAKQDLLRLFLPETSGNDVSKVAKLFVFYERLILPKGGDLFVSPIHDWQSIVHMDGRDFVIAELGNEIT
jgi:hypothetical protein